MFWGFGQGRPTRMPVGMLGRLCHPLPLQQTLKEGCGGGWGDMRRGDLGPATVLSHVIGYECKFFPLLEGGNAVRFFLFVFLCLIRCLLSFVYRSSLLRVAV